MPHRKPERSARRGRIAGTVPGPPKTATTLLLRLAILDLARWKAWAKRKRKPLSTLIREAVERAIEESQRK